MGDALSWYQRHVGGGPVHAPTPVQPGPSYPGTQQVLPRYQQPVPGHMPPGQQYIESQPETAVPVDENGQIHFMDAAVRWRGGKGTKTETMSCPNCGAGCPKCKGRMFFSRKENTKITQNGAAAPAPICYCCGYNGLYSPFGGDLNSAV